jgi:hypothetical protein
LGSRGADTTDPLGTHDLQLPDDVRIYQFSSPQHFGFSPVAPLPTSTGICEQLPDANTYTYSMRPQFTPRAVHLPRPRIQIQLSTLRRHSRDRSVPYGNL